MSLRFVRGLHTTTARLSAEKSSLGFKVSGDRTRTLPSLGVSASARGNIGDGKSAGPIDRSRGPDGRRARPPRRTDGSGQASRPPPISRPRVFDAPTISNSPEGEAAPQTQGKAGIEAVSAEFFEGSEFAAPPPPRQPREKKFGSNAAPRREGLAPRKPRESKGRGVPQFGDGARPGEGRRPFRPAGQESNAAVAARKPRDPPGARFSKTRASSRPPPLALLPVTRDLSGYSLFGKSSLLVTPFIRAKEPQASFWAKGMERADASKADVLRAAGDYSIFTPASPSGKGVKLTASTNLWAIGMNSDISMRRRGAGEEIIKKYLN